jgi:O-antigen ligase
MHDGMRGALGSRFPVVNPFQAAALLVGSLVAGALAVLHPGLVLAAIVVALAGLLLFVLPLPLAASFVLVAVITVPSIWVEANSHSLSIQGTPLTGQAGVLLLVGGGLVARSIVAHVRVDVPGPAIGSVGLYCVGLTSSALVASIIGNAYSGMFSDLLRQLTYPLAFLIGALAVAAGGRRGLFVVIRSVAVIGIFASLLSVWFWLWQSQGLRPGLPLFADVAKMSVYSTQRSIFPFAQDSPNVGAVVFVLLGSFAGVCLLRSVRRADLWLGLTLLVGTGIAVLTTQSRTGLVSLGVAGMSLLLFDRDLRRRPILIASFVGLAVLVVAGYFAFSPDRRFSDTQNFAVRQSIWHQALPKFTASPIFGQGFRFSGRDQFYEIVANPAVYNGTGGRAYSIHNDYLEQLVDAGVVGFTIFIVLLATMWRTVVALLRFDDERRGVGIGFGCLLAALLASMSASSLLESAAASVVVWLFFGIASAAEEST